MAHVVRMPLGQDNVEDGSPARIAWLAPPGLSVQGILSGSVKERTLGSGAAAFTETSPNKIACCGEQTEVEHAILLRSSYRYCQHQMI
jgi:hypothetical protein